MHVVIFEGSRWTTFAPLSLSRPVFTLMTGTGTLLEKQVRHLKPTRLTLWVRPELEEHCRVRLVPEMPCPTEVNVPLDDEPALLTSGRTVHMASFEYPPHQAVVTTDDENSDFIRAAFVQDAGLSGADALGRTPRWQRLLNLPHMMPQGRIVESLWDLIAWNEDSLIEDATQLRDRPAPKAGGPYHMVHEEDIWIDPAASICAGAVLDASKGPVVIASGATVGANSVLQGPCYIGHHTFIRPLSLIRAGTTIGRFCTVGGEVSNSIMLGDSNKAHDGYLGDSYLGKWVNFGAGTTTSNLKNTYGEITLDIAGRKVPTGRLKLGALVGDHSKTGILTRLTAGTYIGFCSMYSAAPSAPRFIPSYSFWTDKGREEYQLEKAIEVTRRVYTRRDRQFTPTDERVMQYVARSAGAVERAEASEL